MRLVKQLDHHFYSAYIHKFVMYYSPTDGWAPLEHYRTLKAAYPDHSKLWISSYISVYSHWSHLSLEHFYLCEKQLQHDFSLGKL